MTSLRTFARPSFAALLCVSLVVWSVMPAATHAPTLAESIQHHLEMIAEHGHAHGFAHDLLWALHGHSHDAADHDHSQAVLVFGIRPQPAFALTDTLTLKASPAGPLRKFRIERPPRA